MTPIAAAPTFSASMNWSIVHAEILLLTMACVVTLVDLWVRDEKRRVTFWLTQITLVVGTASSTFRRAKKSRSRGRSISSSSPRR